MFQAGQDELSAQRPAQAGCDAAQLLAPSLPPNCPETSTFPSTGGPAPTRQPQTHHPRSFPQLIFHQSARVQTSTETPGHAILLTEILWVPVTQDGGARDGKHSNWEVTG